MYLIGLHYVFGLSKLPTYAMYAKSFEALFLGH